jgi:hypothetical protein
MDRNAKILLATFIITTGATYYYITLPSVSGTGLFITFTYIVFSIICGFGATAIVAEAIE